LHGYKDNQLINENRRNFDQITRCEQKKIEHINTFIKKWKSLTSVFNGSQKRLIYISMIAPGVYNFKKLNGYYLPTPCQFN
jgi:hypothetical protein